MRKKIVACLKWAAIQVETIFEILLAAIQQ